MSEPICNLADFFKRCIVLNFVGPMGYHRDIPANITKGRHDAIKRWGVVFTSSGIEHQRDSKCRANFRYRNIFHIYFKRNSEFFGPCFGGTNHHRRHLPMVFGQEISCAALRAKPLGANGSPQFVISRFFFWSCFVSLLCLGNLLLSMLKVIPLLIIRFSFTATVKDAVMFVLTFLRAVAVFALFRPRTPSRKRLATQIAINGDVHNGSDYVSARDLIIAHFQYTGGLTLAQLQAGKVIA